MTTKSELIAQFKAEYPTLQTGSEESGYTILSDAEYNKTIEEWADAKLAKDIEEARLKAERQAKISAYQKLGLTETEIETLVPTPKPIITELLGGN